MVHRELQPCCTRGQRTRGDNTAGCRDEAPFSIQCTARGEQLQDQIQGPVENPPVPSHHTCASTVRPPPPEMLNLQHPTFIHSLFLLKNLHFSIVFSFACCFNYNFGCSWREGSPPANPGPVPGTPPSVVDPTGSVALCEDGAAGSMRVSYTETLQSLLCVLCERVEGFQHTDVQSDVLCMKAMRVRGWGLCHSECVRLSLCL